MIHTVAYVGSVLTDDQLALHSGASVAGNRYQMGFLRALGKHVDHVSVFTMPPNRLWRGSGSLWISAHSAPLAENVQVNSLPYVNLLLAKQVLLFAGVLGKLADWAWRNRRRSDRVIIVYNSISYLTLPAILVARASNTPLVLLVADLPLAEEEAGWLRGVEARMERRLIRFANGLVCITRHIGGDWGAELPAVVLEGAWEEPESCSAISEELALTSRPGASSIVFAGALNSLSGIELAFTALEIIDRDSVTLHVYGSGPLAQRVNDAVKAWPTRVNYHGQVPHEVVLQAEAAASVLILPRIPDGNVTRYTFPSKLIEYMRSGTPVVCNELEGIPPEYFDHVNIPSGPDASSWAQLLVEIIDDDSGNFSARARAAADFVVEKKTWEPGIAQVVHLLEMLRAG